MHPRYLFFILFLNCLSIILKLHFLVTLGLGLSWMLPTLPGPVQMTIKVQDPLMGVKGLGSPPPVDRPALPLGV